MKTLLLGTINLLARLTLKRFKPRIVGITGSVGKTSTKEAIFCVLQNHMLVRASQASYNNEFGLPLTILGFASPGKQILKWVGIIIGSLFNLLRHKYPQVLILEMGADRTGDIQKLLAVTGQIELAVITDIGISHLENYSSQQALINEKLSIAKGVGNSGRVILNADNKLIQENLSAIRSHKFTFGVQAPADVKASDVQVIKHNNSYGLNFKVHYQGTMIPCYLPDSLGLPSVYNALAAIAVGLSLGLNLVQISEALKSFSGAPGRLRWLAGIKHTWIIDDTYNAAPASTIAALDALAHVAQGRRVAVIGDMAELGEQTDAGHRQVAVKIQEINAAVAVCVGQKSQAIVDELSNRKFEGKVLWFATSDEARMPVQNAIEQGDTILVKGSQSARMEKIVKEIMAEPLQADKVLVRQGPKWQK